MSRKFIVFSTFAIATLILSACGANININLFTAEEVVSKSFSTDGTPHIVVEMFNGSVDVVTIGMALHWMDRDASLARLDTLVAPSGMILVCSSHPATDGSNPWLDDYSSARRDWSDANLWSESGSGARVHRNLDAFFRGTRFRLAGEIKVETHHDIGLRDLARRVLTYSSSSPQVLGDRVDAMLCDVEARLAAFSRQGAVTEAVASIAQLVTR